MSQRHLRLTALPEQLAVCRLAPNEPIPDWAMHGAFWSLTRTADELSLVCSAAVVPPNIVCESGWRALKVAGPLDFAMVGVLAALATPLAAAQIALFVVSTFDTDYLLVRAPQLDRAITALRAAGHDI